jgi:hypothetical protein
MKNIFLSLVILMTVTASAQPCLTIGFTSNNAIITALKDGEGVRSANIEVSKSSATKVIVRLQSYHEITDKCVEVSACSGELKVESSGSCDNY